MGACDHIGDIDPNLPPRVDGVCEECVKLGEEWTSLRVCKTCGHVGCCDSSPNHHARLHYEATGHPVVGPADVDEPWLWCYTDQTFVGRVG